MQQPTVRPAPGGPARPVVDAGAGAAGLATAADLRAYDVPVLVPEAGDPVGAAMRAWGHVRTFTPWDRLVDPSFHSCGTVPRNEQVRSVPASRDLTPLADPTAARGEVRGMEDCCDDLQGCDTGCC